MSIENLREEKAFEALVISSLRKAQEGECDVDANLELTEKDRTALKLLGPDFVGRLIHGELHCRASEEREHEGKLSLAGNVTGEPILYRSEGIDEDVAKELDERDHEIIERKKKQQDDKATGK